MGCLHLLSEVADKASQLASDRNADPVHMNQALVALLCLTTELLLDSKRPELLKSRAGARALACRSGGCEA